MILTQGVLYVKMTCKFISLLIARYTASKKDLTSVQAQVAVLKHCFIGCSRFVFGVFLFIPMKYVSVSIICTAGPSPYKSIFSACQASRLGGIVSLSENSGAKSGMAVMLFSGLGKSG
jgi:hypothetical protein